MARRPPLSTSDRLPALYGRRTPQELRLARAALAIEAQEAQAAGQLGFMARFLVQATLPHVEPTSRVHTRSNGFFRLSILSPDGLPYGRYPRLILAWVCTTVVTTRARVLDLGPSLTAFFQKLGITPTGGRFGTIDPVRKQAVRLFASTISMTFENRDLYAETGFRLTEHVLLHKRAVLDETASPVGLVQPGRTILWWQSPDPAQGSLFSSYVSLTEDFYRAILEAPVPIDLRALMALRSPLGIDIYVWLTYRYSYLKRETSIPWGALALQFGSDYARTKAFAAHFRQQLRKVVALYPSARVEPTPRGLILRPARTHIPKRSTLR